MAAPWLLYLSLTGFMCGILYTLISIRGASNISAKKDVASAITTICIVNGALCLTLAGTGYFSVNSILLLKRPYVFVVLHATLIFAMIGFCVSTLKQLGVDPTKVKPDAPSSSSKPGAFIAPELLQVAIGVGSTGFGLAVLSIILLMYLYSKGKFS